MKRESKKKKSGRSVFITGTGRGLGLCLAKLFLEKGYTVLLDELETSLHPLLVREFLRLLFSEKYNSKGAQIIFTTHNPFILDTDLIRRDQIWFTEKDEEGGTHLYPLTDYKPRNNESLTRGYLAGRYGAVPFIPDGLKKS